jgi:hypothetical protein
MLQIKLKSYAALFKHFLFSPSMDFVIFEKNLMEIIFKASSEFNGGGVLLVIIILLVLFGRNKTRKAKCRVCSWRGSRKLWDQYGGCPNCNTDETPKEYSE